jgi:phage shock protein A
MNFFKRLFKIGQSEAHSALDGLEDPIKLTEQGIRDLKVDLDKSLHALAEVKALAIRARNEASTNKAKGEDYEKKALIILKRGQSGEMDSAEADRLATEALSKKKECEAQHERALKEQGSHDSSVQKLEVGVKNLKSSIGKWENELKTLKARAKVAKATKNINKQMANIDTSSTVSMLEKMKSKVVEEEALAESYADIANESRSIDEELDKAITDSEVDTMSDELAKMKAKL